MKARKMARRKEGLLERRLAIWALVALVSGPGASRAEVGEMPEMEETTAEEVLDLLWGADMRTCGPRGLPEPVPPAGDETGGSEPVGLQPRPAGGNFVALGVGETTTVTSWVPCYAGTSQCTGGRHLMVGRVSAKYNPGGSATATIVPYFPTSGGYCGAYREVGPIFRNNGQGFLDVHLGNTWLFDMAQDGGGIVQVALLDVPPDNCLEDFRVGATLREGAFVGTVTPQQVVVPYLPLTIALNHSSSDGCSGCADVAFHLREYASPDCTGPVTRYISGDWARRWQLSEGVSDEARSDRGSYCDGQYGDPGGSWHLPDTVIGYPGSPGHYTYWYEITVGQGSECPVRRVADQGDTGCFALYWGP